MSHSRNALHISVCDCPHVNLVIADENDQVLAHFAASPQEALKIAANIEAAAKAGLRKLRTDKVGAPRGRA
jgi:hypothetical protein